MQKSYQNYLFDADGTLIDTVELICQSFKHVFDRYESIDFDRQQIIGDMGKPLLEMMETYFPNQTDTNYDEITDVYRKYQLSIFHNYLAAFPNVKSTLSVLKDLGKKLVVVTSRKSDTAIEFLKLTEIFEYFDAVVTPELTEEHKPKPEPALKALELIGGDASESVFIGDSAFDIICGDRAEMDTVFVGWSHSDPAEFKIQPTFQIEDMRDLL